jgi:hypothetical protein
MENKYSTFAEIKNRVFTPKEIQTALENLPFNFRKITREVLDQWKGEGGIDKTFSARYITMVRTQENDSFNEIVMSALVLVGLEEYAKRKRFPGRNKKTSQTI